MQAFLDHTETPRCLRFAQPPGCDPIAVRSVRAEALTAALAAPIARPTSTVSARPGGGHAPQTSSQTHSCFRGLDWHRFSLRMPIDSPRFDTRHTRLRYSDAAASSDGRARRIAAASISPQHAAHFPHNQRRIRPTRRCLLPTFYETETAGTRKR
ncbi:hypothetical protein [Lysobacter sp. CA196]|uniref:hypothetical protein n=1 Tax=Lysobacter sp. CA196 TaxID=3455606 RepID=UPI003F8D5E4C